MIEMLERHEVQVLRRAGHMWKEIAALSGVSVRTVRRCASDPRGSASLGDKLDHAALTRERS
jgi:hypothetical protein